MTSVAPHLAAQQQQHLDPVSAQQLIQGQLAQQQALMAQQQRQYPQQQMTPYGFLGDLAGSVLPQVGSWVGQQLGSPQLGQQFGGIAGQLAQRFSPWEAGPSAQQYPQAGQQMTPYGFLGDLAGSVLPQVGSWVGQQFGSPQLGQQFGGIAGQLAQRFSPWEAGPSAPQAQQQYPQQQYPQAQYPQQQYPQQQHQHYPQQQFPQAQFPQAQFPQAQYPQQQVAQQQLAPYGLIGGLAGSFLGGAGGRAIGDLFGGSQLGETIGRGAGGILGSLFPFGVNPAQYAGYAQPGMAYPNGYVR